MLMTWQYRMFDTSFRKKNIFIYFALLDECILEVYCSNIGEYCLKLSAIFQKNLKIPRDYQKPPIDKRMGKTINNGWEKTTQKTKARVAWTPLRLAVNPDTPQRLAVPLPLVTH